MRIHEEDADSTPSSGTFEPPYASGTDDETLVGHFRTVFQTHPEKVLYRFLANADGAPSELTGRALDVRARAIAATLGRRVAPGDRALIVCPPGLDYLASFLGCLYARVIAVPVYPPDPLLMKRTLPRLAGVVADARPAAVLATEEIAASAGEFARHAPGLEGLDWLAVDRIEDAAADGWRDPAARPADPAFLQYTSGSTGRPKGVVVGHGNLVHNLRCINDRLYGREPDNHMVTWLPPYHDMGLIGGLLAPAFGAFPTTFMSPVAFLKQPLRWLRAISEYRATISGAPNFAYDLCVERISEAERRELDLSGWRVAFSGAEPVRAETLDRFTRAFAPSGFGRSAFLPCYGLAEGTLCVSAGSRTAEPVLRELAADALAGHRAEAATGDGPVRTSVGCGWSVDDQRIEIVDPRTRTRVPAGTIGEIWVAGPSVAQGYWERPEESAEVFAARLADSAEGPFLRTGDLGFLDGTELHVTGRAKDLIIVAGRNHYPQDIERTVEECDPLLRPGNGVACAYDADGEERLVVLQEVTGRPEPAVAAGIFDAVRARLAEEHGLRPHHIVLLRRGSIPKTSSGKLQRSAALAAFLAGDLKRLASWDAPAAGGTAASGTTGAGTGTADPTAGARTDAGPDTAGPDPAADPDGHAATAPAARAAAPAGDPAARAELEEWLAGRLADRLGMPAAEVDTRRPLAGYGLRSVDLIGLVGEVEQRLGRPVPTTAVWEYPTVEALAGHLTDPAGTDPAGPAGGPSGEPAEGAGAGPRDPEDDLVAVVGIGCRFPGGADGPEAFWRLLTEGRDAVTEVPEDRWRAADHFDEDPSVPGKTTTAWGGFVDDVDRFDPHFFGISGHEASRMDPQQRLMAEVAWEALEDAGVAAEELAGSATGVFVGIATSDYLQEQFRDLTGIDAYSGTGNAFSIAANRLSYLFDLRGPSMAVDTACSSSLVAVHTAVRSLARGDCTMAIAGGVNVILSPALAVNFSKAGAMAADGRCKPFDSRADGYVRAEGAGAVVLKPLRRALADRDTVYCVIRGGAVNQDGRSNGIMAPNPQAQEAVLRAAYADAGVRPERVDYVEAHGTGTLLGDPIEAKALAAVVGDGREPDRPCLIGSVKSNLGHLEAAAGIAGLIKTALMLRHRTVPRTLHFIRPNPHIPFDELPLEVADRQRRWPAADRPALAGVSSFGFGGTNAHLVVEEAPAGAAPGAEAEADGPHLLAVSARDEQALRELAARYAGQLEGPAGRAGTARLCAAAALRRTHHEHRLACTGADAAELAAALRAFGEDAERPGLSAGRRRVGRRPRTVFVFAGQGPRWWPLAADLLTAEPVFREVIEECDRILSGHTDWSLREQLAADRGASRLADPAVGQPALIAVQVALAAVWRSRGVLPDAVVGHSVGEIAAAQVAGALSLPDALRVALHRGRVIRSGKGNGRMAVVGVPEERARELLAERGVERVWVAAGNGPATTVLSGATGPLEELAAALDAEGLFCRVLESVDFASHCPLMDPLREDLVGALEGLRPGPAAVPVFSTVTAGFVAGERLDAGYWGENLRRPVLFDRAVTALADAGHDVFVEISPQQMLGDALTERLSLQGARGAVVASLRRDDPGRAGLLGELGRLYAAGFPVDWSLLHGTRTVPMVPLPSYPWQRQRYWHDDITGRRRRPDHHGHPLLADRLRSATEPGTWHWTAAVDLHGFGYLRDHRVDGAVVLPAALVLDTALAAVRATAGGGAALEDVRFTGLTVVGERAQEPTLQLVLTGDGSGAGTFRLFSRGGDGGPEEAWTEVATGGFRTPDGTGDGTADATHRTGSTAEAGEAGTALDDSGAAHPGGAATAGEADAAAAGTAGDGAGAAGELAAVRARCTREVDRSEHYAGLHRAGLEYGPAFQGLDGLWRGEREAVARLRVPEDVAADRDAYGVHPALLDACLQVLAQALAADPDAGTAIHLPVGAGAFRLTTGRARPVWAHADVTGAVRAGEEITGGRVVLFGEDGQELGRVEGITLRRLAGAADRVGEALLEIGWRRADAAPAGAAVPAGRWLLLADRDGVAEALRAAPAARGARWVVVTAGDGYRRLDADRFEVRPGVAEDFAALFADLRAAHPDGCAGVLHAWNLDAALDTAPYPGAPAGPDAGTPAGPGGTGTGTGPGTGGAGDPLAPGRDLGTVSVLHLVRELAAGPWPRAPRLVVLTRGTQRVPRAGGGSGTAAPLPAAAVAQSAVWGLVRVAALEHAELRPVVIDLDPARPAGEAAQLAAELAAPVAGSQLALRGGARYVPELQPWRPPAAEPAAWPRRAFDPARDGNLRLLAERPGILGSLTPTVWDRVPPGPGQVEIEVAAAGLNFSDVLKAMDICPGVPPGITPLGAECAGRVVAVGEGVTDVRVGDEVMAVAPSAMAAYATTRQELVAARPAGLDAAEAAALPIAFLTAVYGLEYLAHLGEGETVLIHSATGGVGLAALQVARRNGAEVFATAGTEEKRELLRSLGVRHVMDSRSLDFADRVRELTGGRGVDVVLNSLTGEALRRSLGLLAANGRFVEIGKQDVYNNSSLGLLSLKHNRSFLAVDLERSFAEQFPLIRRLFGEVLAGFARGEFTALPVTCFDYAAADAAFSHMAQARHTGKVVLRPTGAETVAVRPREAAVRPGATYLITGGLGALGLRTARHLADSGARHLVLVGRGGPGERAGRELAALRERGVTVAVRSADVSDGGQVAALVAEIDATMPPLAGVVHSAGVLDDGVLVGLDRERFASVAAPKALAAWHLHRATLGHRLDFFVLYSSAAALLGSPGQGNYAAANAFLDGLALHRASHGLPALSVNWGPWTEAGLAASPDRGGALAGRGIVGIDPDDGVAALGRLLPTATAQAAVLPLDRAGLRAAAGSGMLPPLLTGLLDEPAAAAGETGPAAGAVRRELLAVEPGRRRRAVLVRHCTEQVARVLKCDEAKVDVTAPLAGLGFDSLMSLELRKRLESSLGVELPATVVWRFPTVEALVPFLAERMEIALEAGPAVGAEEAAADERPADGTGTDLDDLSDSDVEALLLAKLTELDEGEE
ncbi:SDR family NAD(P)-dependent oxidoreductase [Streptomyces pactum]|uniref:SDR family NAD(P)-dependent oxidoreductase n=1 Tax=Streptomyces pactum TaxID=68249 RepID=UPI003702124F